MAIMQKEVVTRYVLAVVTVWAFASGCRTRGIDALRPDAGRDSSADAYVAVGSDLGPKASDVAPDRFLSPETPSDSFAKTNDDQNGDEVSKGDVAKEVARAPDLVPAGPDPGSGIVADARLAVEVPPSPATDAASLPQDTTIHLSRDQGGADAACVAGTLGWLSLVATFLSEDQKCWADADCIYVSFSDACGEICPVPINRQRVGEFGSQVYGHASSKCSSCPKLTGSVACPQPRGVFCNAGRCEYEP